MSKRSSRSRNADRLTVNPPSKQKPPAMPETRELHSEAPEEAEQDDAIIGTALLASLAVMLVVGVLVGGIWLWYHFSAPEEVAVQAELDLPGVRADTAKAEIPAAFFVDVTREAGIDFVHENGAYGEKLLPETMGSGSAFLDYDNDGDQDLLLVNSSRWPWDPRPAPETPATVALYQNDGAGHFTNVTREAGLDVTLYGMGAAIGDFDNDGNVDVFLTAVGQNRLFRNTGGRFEEVTRSAGVAGSDQQWSTSAAFFDFDNDGYLDLFVVNYVKWSREIDLGQDFRLVGVGRAYGPPTAFEGTFSYLYRNNRDGTFTDVSETAGIQMRNRVTGVPLAKSLGLAPVDVDQDGWMDLIVANDTVQNFVFHNQKDGTFKEIGSESGVAFSRDGKVRGAMGIDTAYFRNDHSLGIAIGNFTNEMSALYVSQGTPMQFFDAAIASGLGPPTRLELTFGLFFFDYDLDGRLDLCGANGHLEQEINKVQESQHYAQSPQLFWNAGARPGSEFVRVPPDRCGSDFVAPMVGRGASYADVDGDGDLDVLLTASGGKPRLLRNDQALGNHWLRLKLEGTASNRSAVGSWVTVKTGDRTLRRQVMPTRSYLSQVELPITFGLGSQDHVDAVEILWPNGDLQQVDPLEVDRLHTITQPAASND